MATGPAALRWLATGIALLSCANLVSGQTGSVAGTVVARETGDPIPGAQVSVAGAGLGTLTGEDGRFLLRNAPVGVRTIQVVRIGFEEAAREITIRADEQVHLAFLLDAEAIPLDEIVVTGVAGATRRAKVPFDVARLADDDLGPVPQPNPISAIQGKIAGVQVVSGSGRPGSAPAVLLRGATSINALGRDQEPLYIVDGVILGSSIVDIDALDIESIEVVKGAAGSSLYGSRAANGVIRITTKSGRELPDQGVRFTVRTEYGESGLASIPASLVTEVHEYALTEDGLFVDAVTGEPCEWLYCSGLELAGQNAGPGESPNEWNTYKSQRWPGRTYNQVKRFFRNGTFMQNYVGAEVRSGATNFHISMANLQDGGVMPGQEGFDRTGFRVNVDQVMAAGLEINGSAFYSRSTQDQFPEISYNPLFRLAVAPAGVDLLGEDPRAPGELILIPNPYDPRIVNPIYELLTREYTESRGRFLGAATVRWSPLEWLRVDGNVSYDRLDLLRQDLYPKSYRDRLEAGSFAGSLDLEDQRREALNANLTASVRFTLTRDIVGRTQLRYLYESQDTRDTRTRGEQFAADAVPVLQNLDQTSIRANSMIQEVLSDGYFAITNIEIKDRYIIDALVRNDGSSLFGAGERRQWYYRIAGAWRLAPEPWFNLDTVDELKLRYSLGTAGGRPSYSAQYETYSVADGRIAAVTFGNKDLRPEFSVEQEVGVDAAFLNGRVVAGLTYAHSETEDQILPVPLAAYTGFQTQWQNAGTLTNDSWEVSLEADLVRSADLAWSARFLYDRTTSEITELNVPPFKYGGGVYSGRTMFYAREGERFGTFYGLSYAQSCDDLPQGTSCDGFAVNDDGWLVWVGDGGFADPQWGTDSGTLIRGAPVKWGAPFPGECIDGATGEPTMFCPVGNSIPDYNLSISSTLSWKGLTVYGLLDASQGFDVLNQPLQWALSERFGGIMDQTGVPENERKPLGYFSALAGSTGVSVSSAFVEDASFWKLREISLSYRFGPEMLNGVPGLHRFQSIGINATGRNLFTWTDYRGYDPEVGASGGETGSAAVARTDGYHYPNFRTWTVGLEVVF